VKIDRRLTQANIILGHAGVSRENPDYYALTMMNYILGGGGFSSRLMEEVRNKRGLAYSVHSFFDPGKLPGSFQVALQTRTSPPGRAILDRPGADEANPDGARFGEGDRGGQEIPDRKFPHAYGHAGKTGEFFSSRLEYYGLGLDYPEKYSRLIQSVTRERAAPGGPEIPLPGELHSRRRGQPENGRY